MGMDRSYVPQPLPDWLSYTPPPDPPRTDAKALGKLMNTQFEAWFPRLLELVCAGWSVNKAVDHLPATPPLDQGAFMKWVHRDRARSEMLRNAKRIRTEWYLGRMIELAEGSEENPVELDRAKVAIDMYKWFVSRENKADYGETKTIEMNTSISITAALEQAGQRVIEAQVISDDDDDLFDYKRLKSGREDYD